MTDNNVQVTLLLNRWQAGDQQALDKLIPQVYSELHRLAQIQLQRNKKNSIQCTELISEAYLRLVDADSVDWQNRTHFFSMAARTMRRVLVEQYRKNNANKRGNNQTLLTFKEEFSPNNDNAIQLDTLDSALLKLEQLDSRQAEIVTMKYFGGLTNEEIAEVLSVSSKTVQRDWSVAKLWLFRELQQ
ncbi:sigma-70 family RNA polymerase sigma factor [Marinicella rhabdoformis]|uniref:sigma-70 family RNA polymerase sigma factor n=1 Tax=Marinicella rhabdoformis TaxID=2580566 RepID=UPI0012AECCDC|nr:sigma-70 family RNA polymerase sigma factor [Marinicella rhabdoformis]